ncbi:uncharacterized protein LOC128951949 isoform X2 [Oppia nitens]|uniref:uncharacterized protein LOC128951949 isoform X2 n=1 Tax=Oppia nitens TaxID=1686743 RepID=UPI0023DA3ED6|nr:uncharacterized protein LOC128951949 isoform X2 [Oppia nitens]
MLEESTGNFSATRNVYDWYQTSTHVILNIMIKNLKESDVKVKLIDETLDSIYVSESNWTVTPSKLEVKLKKTDRKRWQSLEVLPDKTGKRPLSFVGFVQQQSPTKKANTEIIRVNTSLVDESTGPKYDWHQTPNSVIISIHIPNLTEQDVRVEFGENTLFWSCKHTNDPTFNVKLSLFKPIIVDESSWKLTVSKLEIELKKKDGGRWANLEAPSQTIKSANWVVKTEEESEAQSSSAEDSNQAITDDINNGITNDATTSVVNNKTFDLMNTIVGIESDESNTDDIVDNDSAKTDDKVLQNLDKIVNDFKEREAKESADGTVDELLREIYEKGGDEVRRAMNNRFTKTGGQNTDELKDEEEQQNKDEESSVNNQIQIDLTDDVCDQINHTLDEPIA